MHFKLSTLVALACLIAVGVQASPLPQSANADIGGAIGDVTGDVGAIRGDAADAADAVVGTNVGVVDDVNTSLNKRQAGPTGSNVGLTRFKAVKAKQESKALGAIQKAPGGSDLSAAVVQNHLRLNAEKSQFKKDLKIFK
ncbi:hypothetical protein BDF14DRAFT_1290923 [Spinellus fusiger]|nr:hypothetical protein BDF14DRAFT_1290923 [Spinellus fusiger]